MPRARKSKKKGNPYLSLVDGHPESGFSYLWKEAINIALEHRAFDFDFNLLIMGYIAKNIDIYAEKPYKAVIELVTPNEDTEILINGDRTISVKFNYGKASRVRAKERIRRFRIHPLVKKSDMQGCSEEINEIVKRIVRIHKRNVRDSIELNPNQLKTWEEVMEMIEHNKKSKPSNRVIVPGVIPKNIIS